MTTVVGTKLGRYEVLKCLARGATTDLFLARTRGMAGFERHVVIKRIHSEHSEDPAFVQAFMTEARLAAILHHNNIVQVQDIGEDGGAPYFAMEYVHGEDVRSLLAHLIRKGESLPFEHVITIVTAVASALHHAHERQTPDGKPLAIVHRDVTPSNILVGYDGNVKVVDFGIAKATITITTQVGQLKGRAPYMAPEQCAGKPIDRRSDVFALGIVLWEMSAMRRLFKGVTDHDTMQKIVLGDVPKPSTVRSDIPQTLESIIMKALAKVPGERYQSAAELATALETFAASASLASSTSALATYLAQHLGPRPEPWLVEGSAPIGTAVDFDSEEATAVSADDAKPLLPEPSTVKVKPIPKLVQSAAPVVLEKRVASGMTKPKAEPPVVIVPPKDTKAVPAKPKSAELAAEKKPDDAVETVKAKVVVPAKADEPTASASIVIAEEVGAPAERAKTDLEVRAPTQVGNPPPPPKPDHPDKHDMTELVKPLPLGVGDETGKIAATFTRKRLIAAGIGAGVIVLGVFAFKILTHGSKSDAATPPTTMPAPSASGETQLVQPELPAKPAEPAAAPSEPAPGEPARPGKAIGKVDAYAAKPANDPPPANTWEPVEVGAKPAEPTAKPAEPTAKPDEPAAKPAEPAAKVAEPVKKPAEPVVKKPAEPVVKKPAEPAIAKPHVTPKKPVAVVKKPATPKKPPAPPKPKYDPNSLFLKAPK